MTQPEDCVQGARNEEKINELQGRVERIEAMVENSNERLWQELTALRREMSAMREDFAKEVSATREEFVKAVTHRLPPWVTIGFSVLSGIVGALASIALKVIGG